MSNRTVPAAAEGMPIITRREALRTLLAGAACGAVAATAIVTLVPSPQEGPDEADRMTEEFRALWQDLDADGRRAIGALVKGLAYGADPSLEILAAVGVHGHGMIRDWERRYGSSVASKRGLL